MTPHPAVLALQRLIAAITKRINQKKKRKTR